MTTAYFSGQRDVLHLTRKSKDGRTRYALLAYEEWIPLHHDALACGASNTSRIRCKTGVKREEKSGFESEVSSALGIENLLHLKSKLKGTRASTDLWEEEHEMERTVVFTAPQCGSYSIRQYQLSLTTHFRSQRKSLFGTKAIQCSLTERLPFYHDGSISTEREARCNCPPPDQPIVRMPTDLRFVLQVGSVSTVLPASFETSGFTLRLPNHNLRSPQTLIAGGELEIRREWLAQSTMCLLPEATPEVLGGYITPTTQVADYIREPSQSSNSDNPFDHLINAAYRGIEKGLPRFFDD
jgi:hypothetical protein